MEKKAVLIFDAAQRSALAATRSLGKRQDTLIYTTDKSNQALAGSSRYSNHYLTSPDPAQDASRFADWVATTVKQYNIEFLLPVTEVTSRTLLEQRHLFPQCKLPFAELDTVLALSDKNRLTQMAEKVGVPVPRSLYLNNAAELPIGDLAFPCVLKPSLSKVAVGNQWVTTQVHIVHTRQELEDVLKQSPYFENHPFMAQQYIAGHGAGLFCYYQHGQAKAFFAHKRIREKPPSGGVSVLSESVAVAENMKRHATALLDAVSWHGAAMVEFKVDSVGTPYLMEINTRLWGSLQLAIDAGVNFPELLFDGEYQRDLTPVRQFHQGIQLRWLLGDVDNLYINLRDSSQSWSQKIAHIGQFFKPKWSHRRHEINRMDDLGPFWYELKHYFNG